jgi:hypothetical protein
MLRPSRHIVAGISMIALAFAVGACQATDRSNTPEPRDTPTPVPTVPIATTQATEIVADTSGQEWLDSVFECLREAGWNANPTFDGGWTVDVPPEHRPAFRTAQSACEAKVGPMPAVVPLTQEQIIHRYAYLLEMRACLINLGYEISEPPSLKEFVDTWATGPWSPYLDLPTGPTPETERSCPQVEPR